ncbi:hypothetical protein [Paenibacillus lacisoli]|nr:hypothetical protein [Paenibacillus sp. JX-17]
MSLFIWPAFAFATGFLFDAPGSSWETASWGTKGFIYSVWIYPVSVIISFFGWIPYHLYRFRLAIGLAAVPVVWFLVTIGIIMIG